MRQKKAQKDGTVFFTYVLQLVIHWIGYIIFEKYKCSCCWGSIHSCWLPDDSCSVGRRSWHSLANNNYQAVSGDLMIEFCLPLMCTYCKQSEKKHSETVLQVAELLGVTMDLLRALWKGHWGSSAQLWGHIWKLIVAIENSTITVSLVEMWHILYLLGQYIHNTDSDVQ